LRALNCPDAQAVLIEISGVAWIGAFALFLAKYAPTLLAPRT
jgi:uncharacterized protein involved in response to NO